MALMRKQTYITGEQDRDMKRLARHYGLSEAEIMRRALDGWLRQEAARDADDPFAGLIGFVDGPSEVRHDDIYG